MIIVTILKSRTKLVFYRHQINMLNSESLNEKYIQLCLWLEQSLRKSSQYPFFKGKYILNNSTKYKRQLFDNKELTFCCDSLRKSNKSNAKLWRNFDQTKHLASVSQPF